LADLYDIIIIGGGPAGLAAALYGARGLHPTLVIDRGAPGGMLNHAEWVVDYPSLHEGMTGAGLGSAMWEQAAKFGATAVQAEVTGIAFEGGLKVVQTGNGEFRARALIVATGGEPHLLGVPGERELSGRGVWSCPIDDPVPFAGQRVVVVGSGDSALTTALRLAPVAASVTVVHRRAGLSAIEAIQEDARRDARIVFLAERTVQAIEGNGRVTGILFRGAGGEGQRIAADAVVVAIGFRPATGLLSGLCPLDEDGYAIVDEWMATGVPGLFVAGDVRREATSIAISAAGDGATAAIAADHFLSNPE
jgi:thioredoxin reductase (NADPH)